MFKIPDTTGGQTTKLRLTISTNSLWDFVLFICLVTWHWSLLIIVLMNALTASEDLYCRLTCFLSVAGTWLKYSQACQNKMFSSLNSFLRNSCRETHSNHSFKCYLTKCHFFPFCIAAITVVDVVVETRKQILECDVRRRVGVWAQESVGDARLWLVLKEGEELGGSGTPEPLRCCGLRSKTHLLCGKYET